MYFYSIAFFSLFCYNYFNSLSFMEVIMANNGKFYEELIYRYLYSKSFRVEEDIYGESYVNELFYVHKDVRINSAKTSNTRQVDILINKKNNCRIAVECKDYSTPLILHT